MGRAGRAPHQIPPLDGGQFCLGRPHLDLAFIPIAPARPDRKIDRWGHASPEEALDIFSDVGAKAMIPIHFEAYYSRGTDHGAPRRRLIAEVERRGLSSRVFALYTGEGLALGDGEPRVLGESGPRVAGR